MNKIIHTFKDGYTMHLSNTYQSRVYIAMIKAQEQFDDSTDEWVELELIISNFAYDNEDIIWPRKETI